MNTRMVGAFAQPVAFGGLDLSKSVVVVSGY